MEGNKQVKIYVGRSMTLYIFCFMLQDYAWTTSSQCFYSGSVVWVHITSFCILAGFMQGQPPKTANKELCQVSEPFPTIINYH